MGIYINIIRNIKKEKKAKSTIATIEIMFL